MTETKATTNNARPPVGGRRRRRYLVIGGGIAGLAAAEEATRHDADVVVVESADAIGGLLSTDRRAGYSFDRGGHRFITALPWVLDRMRELLGDRLLVRTRRSVVMLDGTTIDYPLRFVDLLTKLGPTQNLRAILSYCVASSRRRRKHQPCNLEEWLIPRFGRYLYERVFEGYSTKLWGCHPSEISADWAAQRISIPSLGAYVRELVRPTRPAPRTYARTYLYPRTGIGEIPEHFARAIVDAHGTIRVRSEVTALERDAHGWRTAVTSGGVTDEERFDGIVSTIPLAQLAALLGVTGDTAPLPSRGLRFLNLGFEQAMPSDWTWIYQPDPACRFTRIQIPAARSPEMTPPGCGSMQFEEPLNPGEESSRDERVGEALATIERLGLHAPTPTLVFESRAADAYPIYEPGHRKRAHHLCERIQRDPLIRVAGRQGRFDYIFLDRALAQGVNAIRYLLGLAPYGERVGRGIERPIALVEANSIVDEFSSTA